MNSLDKNSNPTGIHRIASVDYHADNVIRENLTLSRSLAWDIMTQCPQEGYMGHPRIGGQRKKPTAAMKQGSLIHALLCGHDDDLQVINAADYKTDAAKLQRATAIENGKLPVLRDKFYDAIDAVGNIEKLLNAEDINPTRKNQELTAIAQVNGVWCRVRPDLLDTENGIIFDWKTTTDLSDRAINGAITRYGYWFQSLFYRRVIEAATGKPHTFVLVFIRLEPLAVRVVDMSRDWDILMPRVDETLKTWRECLESGIWPSYPRMESTPPQYLVADSTEPDFDGLDCEMDSDANANHTDEG
jgi:hypothetical protein